MTTPTTLLNALLPLVAELPSRLPETERYRRLLAALRAVLPGDAAALLRCERGENGDDWLRPLAIDGLSPDTLGRRFRVAEHPRQVDKANRLVQRRSRVCHKFTIPKLMCPEFRGVEHLGHATLPSGQSDRVAAGARRHCRATA